MAIDSKYIFLSSIKARAKRSVELAGCSLNSISKYDKVMDLATRRGFLWQSYEIYGGVAGFYDLGPLGVLLKNNIVELWREYFVKQHQEFVVEIETPIITPAHVFRASGHEEHFTDFAVSCTKCGRLYRADHLIKDVLGMEAEGLSLEELNTIIREKSVRCPACGGELSEVRRFLLLFQTYIGPYSPENLAYLRPEAAQGMFVNFKRVYEVMRRKLPLGIAQIGRVARNEISPRQGPIRLREFTIMEIEFFYDDKNPQADILYHRCQDDKIRILTAEERRRGEDRPIEITPVEAYESKMILSPWLAYWMCIANKFVHALGVPLDRIYFEEKLPEELAHYSKQTFDQIVIVDKWGKLEVSGHAYRHTYDLEQHMKFTKTDLYAVRHLAKPVRIKKKTVRYDKKRILEIFGSQAREVFKVLSKYRSDELLKTLESSSGDSIVVEGIALPKDVFTVVEEEEIQTVEKFVPHVAEPSFGAERLLYVALEYAYTEEDGRVVLKLPPRIAPIKVAVFPLVEKEPIVQMARRVYEMLKEAGFYVIYDESGSIGRRYVRADEIGIPFAITVDYDTITQNDVTIRDRDTRKQIRVPIPDVIKVIERGIKGENILMLGYPVVGSNS